MLDEWRRGTRIPLLGVNEILSQTTKLSNLFFLVDNSKIYYSKEKNNKERQSQEQPSHTQKTTYTFAKKPKNLNSSNTSKGREEQKAPFVARPPTIAFTFAFLNI